MGKSVWAIRCWRIVYLALAALAASHYAKTGGVMSVALMSYSNVCIVVMVAFALHILGYWRLQSRAAQTRTEISVGDVMAMGWIVGVLSPVGVELAMITWYEFQGDQVGKHVLYAVTVIGLLLWQVPRWENRVRRLAAPLEAGAGLHG
jgi:hypothetical protein